jgi:hypothetical protein
MNHTTRLALSHLVDVAGKLLATPADQGCAAHGLAHPCEACAAELPLRDLLEEVRQCFTRDDDLPGDLLPRIDAALDRVQEVCRFPDCKCPMDPGPSVDWCARGLPHAQTQAAAGVKTPDGEQQ